MIKDDLAYIALDILSDDELYGLISDATAILSDRQSYKDNSEFSASWPYVNEAVAYLTLDGYRFLEEKLGYPAADSAGIRNWMIAKDGQTLFITRGFNQDVAFCRLAMCVLGNLKNWHDKRLENGNE